MGISERWLIAVDLSSHKVHGDRLVFHRDRAEWYAEHPEAWRLVEVVPAATWAKLERGDSKQRKS